MWCSVTRGEICKSIGRKRKHTDCISFNTSSPELVEYHTYASNVPTCRISPVGHQKLRMNWLDVSFTQLLMGNYPPQEQHMWFAMGSEVTDKSRLEKEKKEELIWWPSGKTCYLNEVPGLSKPAGSPFSLWGSLSHEITCWTVGRGNI